MTLRDMVKGRDPRTRPLRNVELYAANMISPAEGKRLLAQQKLDYARAKKEAEDELYEDVRAMAAGKEPPSVKRRRENGRAAAAAASQLGQQALGFPPLDGGKGSAGDGPAPKKC